MTNSKKILLLFIFLSLSLLNCVPYPEQDKIVIVIRNHLTFPFAFLDFKSAELSIVEVDGVKVLRYGGLSYHLVIIE